MEIDMTIHMAPKREDPVKIRVKNIEEAKPAIDLSEFELLMDVEEDGI